MSQPMRLLPLLLAFSLWIMIAILWPAISNPATSFISGINIVLMLALSLFLITYGLRSLRHKEEDRAGSHLRTKLVSALVGMLLIPTITLHLAANQMVGRSMDVWFDVRVDTLLDQALNLAQGFYARIDNDLKQGLATTMNDTELLLAAELPISYAAMTSRLSEIIQKEGWHSIHVFDLNERLITGVQAERLSGTDPIDLGESAKLAMTLGRITTEFVTLNGDEIAVGYAPIRTHQNIIGLLRIQVLLPEDVVHNARAVEADYRTYRELERNRQSIADRFTHIMLMITLLIITIASLVAIFFARRLTSPIGNLAQALHRVTEGDLNVSITSSTNDELGSLVHSFNRMTLSLKQNTEALEQAQNELTDALNSSKQRQFVMETLLASLQNGVLLANDNGDIRLINQAFRDLLLMDKKHFPISSNLSDINGKRLHKISHFFDELLHQKQGHLQREIELRDNNKNLHILARGTRLKQTESSGFSGYLIVLDDISGLAEAQRHRAWAEVAQRLAHEIKNPLTPIKLSAERLHRRFRDQADNTDVFDSCTHAIIGQVERLQRLISDFSTLARMPKPHLNKIAATEIIADMQTLYAPYARATVEHLADDAHCSCDPDQIRQILINLMDNALSATDSDQNHVHLYSAVQDHFVEFHVKDSGHGVPEDSQNHIFDAYYSTKDDGSGLGLAIAKRIADEHDATLQLLSARSPTHFCLRLALQTSSMEQS